MSAPQEVHNCYHFDWRESLFIRRIWRQEVENRRLPEAGRYLGFFRGSGPRKIQRSKSGKSRRYGRHEPQVIEEY